MRPLWDHEYVVLQDRLVRIARALVHSDLAEDLASDALVVVMERDLREPLPYITLKHLIIDALRRERRQEHEALQDSATPAERDASDGPSEAEAMLERLMQHAALTPLESRVLYERFYNSLSQAACALKLGIGVADAREVGDQALAKLRRADACEDGAAEAGG